MEQRQVPRCLDMYRSVEHQCYACYRSSKLHWLEHHRLHHPSSVSLHQILMGLAYRFKSQAYRFKSQAYRFKSQAYTIHTWEP